MLAAKHGFALVDAEKCVLAQEYQWIAKKRHYDLQVMPGCPKNCQSLLNWLFLLDEGQVHEVQSSDKSYPPYKWTCSFPLVHGSESSCRSKEKSTMLLQRLSDATCIIEVRRGHFSVKAVDDTRLSTRLLCRAQTACFSVRHGWHGLKEHLGLTVVDVEMGSSSGGRLNGSSSLIYTAESDNLYRRPVPESHIYFTS